MAKPIMTLDELKDSRLMYDKTVPAFGYMIVVTVLALLAFVVIWSIFTPKMYMIKSSGVIESENKTYIMSPYTGEIAEMQIEEGTIVEAGDVLLKIKSTDINMQVTQLEEQIKTYELRVEKLKKLVESIQDDVNYFNGADDTDLLYYSQFETYKSQVLQNQADIDTFKAYGYSDEQIETQIVKSQSKITEIYHATIQNAENAILEATTQIEGIQAQLHALNQGQGEYVLTAETSGIIHMMSAYKEGMVVQGAGTIASIASEQDNYQVTAYVSMSDAARVELGDEVDIEVAGLTQTIYGTIDGTVVQKDNDLTTQQEGNNESASYVKMVVEPHAKYLVSKDGDKVNITNGMAVETRIQYDKITYFDYVMESLGVLAR